MEILRLLLADGRRPFSDIAEIVDLSPPAVRDRVDRLIDAGVIRRFTVDVNRSMLQEGVPVLVDLQPMVGVVNEIRDGIAASAGVEHVFVTADAHVIVYARVTDGDVYRFLSDMVDLDQVREYEVTLVTDVEWTPHVDEAAFAIECAECGNTVTSEGESTRIKGSLYHFCCPSCADRFEERHAELERGV